MTAYTNPRLHNRPPITELEPPRPITEFPLMRTSGWRESLTFDAHCELDGLNWFRVQGGFGGRNDREDWVAELPARSLSVTGWELERADGDVTAAMRQAVDRGFEWSAGHVAEARAKLAAELDRAALLRQSVEKRAAQNDKRGPEVES